MEAEATMGSSPSKDEPTKMEEEEDPLKPPSLQIAAKSRPFNARLFGSTVQKGFARLYAAHDLADITLVVSSTSGKWSEKVPAHKMVLCAWSEKLTRLITADSSLKELPLQVNVDQDIFMNMLKYMYTGDVSFINGKNFMAVIEIADEYEIQALKEVCGDIIGEHVGPNNLFYLIDLVNRYHIARLNKACGQYLAENFTAMHDDVPDRLFSLGVDTWVEVLKADMLVVKSEEFLLDCMMQYVYKHAGITAKQPLNDKASAALAKLLPHIRWTFIRPDYLVTGVEKHPQLGPLPLVHKLLHETFRYRMLPSAKRAGNLYIVPRKGFQRFDPDKCDKSCMRLSDDGETATLSSGGWQNVRCLCPFSAKYDYIEFKVNGGTNMMLGVVKGDCARNTHAGQHSNGWSYYSPGQLYTGGTIPVTGKAFTNGDVIGVHVELETGILTFYCNGVQSIKHTCLEKNSTELYPIVCFSSVGSSVTIVRGAAKPSSSTATPQSVGDTYGNGDADDAGY